MENWKWLAAGGLAYLLLSQKGETTVPPPSGTYIPPDVLDPNLKQILPSLSTRDQLHVIELEKQVQNGISKGTMAEGSKVVNSTQVLIVSPTNPNIMSLQNSMWGNTTYAEMLRGIAKTNPVEKAPTDECELFQFLLTAIGDPLVKDGSLGPASFDVEYIAMLGWLQSYVYCCQQGGVYKKAGAYIDKLAQVGISALTSTPMLAGGPAGWIGYGLKALTEFIFAGINQLVEESQIIEFSKKLNSKAFQLLGPPPLHLDDWIISWNAYMRMHYKEFPEGAVKLLDDSMTYRRLEYSALGVLTTMQALVFSKRPGDKKGKAYVPYLDKIQLSVLKKWSTAKGGYYPAWREPPQGYLPFLDEPYMVDGPPWMYLNRLSATEQADPKNAFAVWRNVYHQSLMYAYQANPAVPMTLDSPYFKYSPQFKTMWYGTSQMGRIKEISLYKGLGRDPAN